MASRKFPCFTISMVRHAAQIHEQELKSCSLVSSKSSCLQSPTRPLGEQLTLILQLLAARLVKHFESYMLIRGRQRARRRDVSWCSGVTLPTATDHPPPTSSTCSPL